MEHLSVPTGLNPAKTFLQEEYLKDIGANDDEKYFILDVSAIIASRNTELLIQYRLPFVL